MADEKLLTQKTETHTTRTVIHEEQKAGLLSSVLAIIGFIILIVIILWGLFHITSLASPWLSSLFNNRTSNAIQVTAPTNATSSTPFTVSWKHSTSEKGIYALLYQCKDTFRLEMSDASGAANIPCGAAFTVPATEKKVSVTPILSGTVATSIPLSIIFIPSATSSKQAQGGATVLVHPGSIATPPTQTVAPVTPVKPRVAAPADLSVRIIAASVDQSGMAVVEFDIANEGGSASGAYSFEAYLPAQGTYTYNSPVQSSLGPGGHIMNTLRFSQTTSGTVSIVVDSANAVHESDENNNYASQSLYFAQYNNYLPTGQAGNYTPQQYPYQYVY
jgi:hypothetical protein